MPADFLIVLCDLINALILHGHAPLSWLSGTILPLLKSASLDKTQVLSYRPIMLSSLFGNIIDIMVLNRYQKFFLTSSRQFGFKKDSSTNHYSFVLKEVISYYLRSNTDVFACALDIKKAFDRVDLIALFRKISLRKFPPVIVRFIFILYLRLSLCVFWNDAFSENFVSLNGVKEGGILSPFLFNIFIDDLLLELERLHLGCYVGLLYCGSIAYTDDVLLLASSLCALRVMLDYCTMYANNNSVLFNAAKFHCIHFNQNSLPVMQLAVSLQNVPLMWTDSIKHLGHVFAMNNNDATDIWLKEIISANVALFSVMFTQYYASYCV